MARRKAKKRFPLFWCFYFLFVLTMVVFWICVVKYVQDGLVRYEASQPVNTMEQIMTRFRENGLEQYLTIEGDISRFEKQEDYAEEFQERLRGKILFYLPAKGYQDPSAPVYELFADGEHIGYVTLKETASEPFFLNLLTMSEWALDKVEVEALQGQKAVEITVPDSYQVWINGVLADEREMTEEAVTSEEFVYSAAYVSVPSFVTYRTEGLLHTPQISIRSGNGDEIPFEGVESKDTLKIALNNFTESEMPADLSNMVLEQAERYTNYFSVDLEGAKGSVAPIRDMFPTDSYYVDLADTYRREDMWMFSAHDKPVFKNEVVNHYIRYNEEFFSCEVYFEKEMRLSKTGKIKLDTTNFRLYYGLLDGKWKILDMVTLLGSEE